jgi:hypothetical protein
MPGSGYRRRPVHSPHLLLTPPPPGGRGGSAVRVGGAISCGPLLYWLGQDSGARADGIPAIADGVLKPLPGPGLPCLPVVPRVRFQGGPVAAAVAYVRAEVVPIAIRGLITLFCHTGEKLSGTLCEHWLSGFALPQCQKKKSPCKTSYSAITPPKVTKEGYTHSLSKRAMPHPKGCR